jgi:hypothetical protein
MREKQRPRDLADDGKFNPLHHAVAEQEAAAKGSINDTASSNDPNTGSSNDDEVETAEQDVQETKIYRYKNDDNYEDEDADDMKEGSDKKLEDFDVPDDDPEIALFSQPLKTKKATETDDTDQLQQPPNLEPLVDGPSNPALISLLLDELRMIAIAGNYNVDDAVNYEKAQNILEATAGDVYTAAQLYWDDYLATLQHQHMYPQPQPPQEQAPSQNESTSTFRNRTSGHHSRLRHYSSSRKSNDDDGNMESDDENTDQVREHSTGSRNNSKHRRHRRVNQLLDYFFEEGKDEYLNDPFEQAPPPLLPNNKNDNNAPNENANIIDPNQLPVMGPEHAFPIPPEQHEHPNRPPTRQVLNLLVRDTNDRNNAYHPPNFDQFLFGLHQNRSDDDDTVQMNNLSQQQENDSVKNDTARRSNKDSTKSKSLPLWRPQQQDLQPPPPPNRRPDGFLRYLAYGEGRMNHDESISMSDVVDDHDADDEHGIIPRRETNSSRRLEQYLNSNSSNDMTNKLEPIFEFIKKKRKLNSTIDGNEEVEHDNTNDEDDYLSENDWMWESMTNSNHSLSSLPTSSPERTSHISFPMDVLWGGGSYVTSLSTNVDTDTTNKDDNSDSMSAKNIDEHKVIIKDRSIIDESDPITVTKKDVLPSKQNDTTSNLINPIDSTEIKDHDGDGDGDDDAKSKDLKNLCGVPRTWMSAGFHLIKMQISTESNESLATSVVGVALQPPSENDFAYYMWKNQQTDNEARHATIPLPYHCRSISSLLSIVTGLMYTGATVQMGGQVSCTSARQPLQELMSDEKNEKSNESKGKLSKGELMYRQLSESDRLGREYDARLIDALTVLLRIAADASMKRKEKALQLLQASNDPAVQRQWLSIKRKLRLVPTCWWEVPPTEIRSSYTAIPKDDVCCLPIIISYTNIDDLRSYVQGNIRAFTSSGGCALFLETIARIHGKGALSYMIHRARKATGHTGPNLTIPLVSCTCVKRHYEVLDNDLNLQKRLKLQSKKCIVYDTTPQGHQCLSVELLSLLLAGRVHSTLQGWSTSPLGLGILSTNLGEVGRGLTRPEKPVWILRGPTCYSVMCLNGCSDHINTFARKDHPGAVAWIAHWNCWYNQRNATEFRLITDRSNLIPRTTPFDDDGFDYVESMNEMDPICSRTVQMLVRRRYQNEFLSRECKNVEIIDPSLYVSNEQMERVTVHPDDPKFYPNQYRMWRYDMGGDPSIPNDSIIHHNKQQENCDSKRNVLVWKSYNKLNDHEKHIIETKLGPKIRNILWTRWPRAIVDRFVPNDTMPVV